MTSDFLLFGLLLLGVAHGRHLGVGLGELLLQHVYLRLVLAELLLNLELLLQVGPPPVLARDRLGELDCRQSKELPGGQPEPIPTAVHTPAVVAAIAAAAIAEGHRRSSLDDGHAGTRGRRSGSGTRTGGCRLGAKATTTNATAGLGGLGTLRHAGQGSEHSEKTADNHAARLQTVNRKVLLGFHHNRRALCARSTERWKRR
mmetsp:Transcript_70516/g.146842  ORF Transcript_70516/g.146842 Transcript_70516/m.146842 type:complete len:202 (-) Transcript_70516:83-688(-)